MNKLDNKKIYLFLGLAILLAAYFKEDNVPIVNQEQQGDETFVTQDEGTPITNNQYERIKEGMTINEVENILGKGKKYSEAEVEGNKTETYLWSWKTGNQSNLVGVVFYNGELHSKSKSSF